MRFKFHTLVDITKTEARFSKSDPTWHQQQNYLTFLQTLGLRVNVEIEKLQSDTVGLDNLNFGTAYKGNHKVWTGEFSIEYEDGLSLEMLENDFHLVPVINNLEETVKLKDCVFDTKSKQSRNIIFKCVD